MSELTVCAAGHMAIRVAGSGEGRASLSESPKPINQLAYNDCANKCPDNCLGRSVSEDDPSNDAKQSTDYSRD
jgi:hypothetical protein